jgi:hypothetical protein
MKPVDTMWKKDLQEELSAARVRIASLENDISEYENRHNTLTSALRGGLLYVIFRWKYISRLL